MILSAIAALAENRVIGYQNRMPWHLPADLRHFKETTVGHPVIMGRKTFLSIGKPLPGRRNIVVSRDPAFKAATVDVFHSIPEILAALKNEEEVFVIGGAEIYQAFWPYLNRLYLTYIQGEFEGDTFFPALDLKEWREVSSESHLPDAQNPYGYRFVVMERKTHVNHFEDKL